MLPERDVLRHKGGEKQFFIYFAGLKMPVCDSSDYSE